MISPTDIYSLLRKKRFQNLQDEKKLQQEIFDALTAAKVVFEREKRVDAKNIFDFFIDGIVIEVKLKGSKRELYNQLERYAQLDICTAVLLVTNVHILMPLTINQKPSYILKLSSSWL